MNEDVNIYLKCLNEIRLEKRVLYGEREKMLKGFVYKI